MNRLLVSVLMLGVASTSFAGKAKPVKFSNAQRQKVAMTYAEKKLGGDVALGWNHGVSPQPVVAKTGSVRVSTGDDPGNTKADKQNGQFGNYFITFGRNNKPNKLTFINQYD